MREDEGGRGRGWEREGERIGEDDGGRGWEKKKEGGRGRGWEKMRIGRKRVGEGEGGGVSS